MQREVSACPESGVQQIRAACAFAQEHAPPGRLRSRLLGDASGRGNPTAPNRPKQKREPGLSVQRGCSCFVEAAVTGGLQGAPRCRRSERWLGQRPRACLSGEGVVSHAGRWGLLVGESASDGLLGAVEIRAPAFRRSARPRSMARDVVSIAVSAGWGSARASTREHASGQVGAGARMRGNAQVGADPNERAQGAS
jgi:hypothetical protein